MINCSRMFANSKIHYCAANFPRDRTEISEAPQLFNDKLALHAAVAQTAKVATLERISARGLRHEFHDRGLPLTQFPTVFRRSENQAGIAAGCRAIGNRRDLETVIMIQSGDLQQNLGSGFDVNRRRRILVFLGVQFNDLDLLFLGRG